jgi:hypothetical protein
MISRIALTAAGLTTATTATITYAAEPDVWNILSQIDVEEIVTDTTYEVRKSFPAPLAGGREMQEVQITGYASPALPGETIKELLLVSDMGFCPFCGSNEHGGALVVELADSMPAIEDASRITLRGTLTPVDDPETWQAAILKNARIVVE